MNGDLIEIAHSINQALASRAFIHGANFSYILTINKAYHDIDSGTYTLQRTKLKPTAQYSGHISPLNSKTNKSFCKKFGLVDRLEN